MTSLLRSRWLDVAYWIVVTPFVSGLLTRLSTLGAIALLASITNWPKLALTFWWQMLPALLLADLVGYWSHRMRHLGVLWRFHAIHHSPTKLDALAAARMHPIDDVIDNTLVGIALFIVGFSPEVIFAIGPILYLHIALIHADVNWEFGIFGNFLVSPVHHRAHHEVGDAKNFAGMFSFFDRLFGTDSVPTGAQHGSGEEIPNSLLGHLAWPFQRNES